MAVAVLEATEAYRRFVEESARKNRQLTARVNGGRARDAAQPPALVLATHPREAAFRTQTPGDLQEEGDGGGDGAEGVAQLANTGNAAFDKLATVLVHLSAAAAALIRTPAARPRASRFVSA